MESGTMIREVTRKDIPACVELIKNSFMTVADEYGFTAENAPRFTAFAISEDRLCRHVEKEHRPGSVELSDKKGEHKNELAEGK